MDYQSLIGLEEQEAKNILYQNDIKNINVIINAKEEDKCNKTLVCAVRFDNGQVTLICGRFYIL